METYPAEVLNECKPAIFLMGVVENEPDIHNRLIRCFENTNYENEFKDFPKLQYRSVSPELQFPSKKASKETPNTEGIIRSNWLLKYHQQLPSVLLFITSFSVDRSLAEWIRREASFHDRYSRLKASLGSRGCNVVYILIKTGAIELVDKDVIEERINSLKRHLQLDTKTLLIFTLPEITANSSVNKRLVKLLREYSYTFYAAQFKKSKLQERVCKTRAGPNEHLLCSRYSLKAAYFLEFLGQPTQSLQYYRQCFQHLLDLNRISVASENVPILQQVKTLCNYINFKIISMLLSNTLDREAFIQFKLFIHFFLNMKITDLNCGWKHATWLCDQYIVYTQLLDKFAVKEQSNGTDRTYFYRNAARYSQERYTSFIAYLSSVDHMRNLAAFDILAKDINMQGLILASPRFTGLQPILYDPVLDKVYDGTAATSDTMKQACHHYLLKVFVSEEGKVDHRALILKYLWMAHDKISLHHLRRKAEIRVLIAEQHMSTTQYDMALTHFIPMIDCLLHEKWFTILPAVLNNKLLCELYLGRGSDYVSTALIQFALGVKLNNLSAIALEKLHKMIFDLFAYQNVSQSEDSSIQLEPSTTAPPSNLDPLFGTYASLLSGHTEELPNPYHIDLSFEPVSYIIQSQAQFQQKVIDVGQNAAIRITLTSNFSFPITFHKIVFQFSTAPLLVKEFTSDTHSLVLTPRKSYVLEFDLFVPDQFLDTIATNQEWGICLESVQLFYRANVIQISALSPNKHRDVIFTISSLTPEFQKKRESFGKVNSIIEVAKYTDQLFVPSILHLKRPISKIELISPIVAAKLCQGTIQRIDVIFTVKDYSLLNCKVYLSVDYSPRSITSSFFWYPDTNMLLANIQKYGNLKSIPRQIIDEIKFYPFLLNSSMQPECPLALPDQQPGSFFTVPLFIRSEIEGLFKIKLLFEYFSKTDITTMTIKEFYVDVLFQNPIAVKFNLLNCIIDRESNHFIYSHEKLNLNYSLQCTHPVYNDSIEIIKLWLGTGDKDKNSKRNSFRLLDLPLSASQSADKLCSFIYYDVLNQKTALTDPGPSDFVESQLILKSGEIYYSCHDFECISEPDISNVTSHNGDTLCHILVAVRVVDCNFMKAPNPLQLNNDESDLQWLLTPVPLATTVPRAPSTSSVPKSDSSSDSAITSHSPGFDPAVSATRVSHLMFNSPVVQVEKSPFEVMFDPPAVVSQGQRIDMTLTIRNTQTSTESVTFQMKLQSESNFLVTGNINTTVYITPEDSHTFELAVYPLASGQLMYPPIVITWLKKSIDLLNTESQSNARYVFVNPTERPSPLKSDTHIL